MTNYQALVDDLYTRFKDVKEGNVADYIPQLANTDPDIFGIAIVTVDDKFYHAGDCDTLFTLQSMSKPFTYGMALEDHGREYMWTRVGVEPTGKSFNAISLDEKTGRPLNPMINAGAIAVADILKGDDVTHKLNRILDKLSIYAGRQLHLDGAVFTSEQQTGHRNRALAHLLRGSNMIRGSIDDALHLYFQQCSLLINTHDLAVMASCFANGGVNPVTGKQALERKYIRDLLSVMYTCGMYDSSGEWAYRIGLPAKSGVSGGIWAVVPNKMGIAVFSPPLDSIGHSVRGMKVFAALAEELNFHVFWSEK